MKENNERCQYGAPMVAYRKPLSASWHIYQSCCNHWDCARCGIERAKQEYGRIVNGLRVLHKEHGDIYFITVTCRGRDMPLKESEENYMKWTNRLITNWRKHAKKKNIHWAYVQVTERQKRGHPHSHILTTYHPTDIYTGTVVKFNKQTRKNENVPALRSDTLKKQIVKCGLGEQYDLSVADDVEATSRYVAKYLFKDSMQTKFPKSWRRVRYSQSFPKLPKQEGDSELDYLPLIKSEHWHELGTVAVAIVADDNPQIRDDISYHLIRKGWEGIVQWKAAATD